MKKHLFWLVALALIAAVPARAETLDEDTIRKVYDEIKSTIHDADKARAVLQERLDDNYTLKSDVTRHVNDQPPQKASATLDKAKTIQDTVDNISRMKMDKFDSDISSIQFSGDHKYAYVNLATTSTGVLSASTQEDKSKLVNFDYAITETCTQIVGLVQDRVKIMQAQCDDDATLKKQP
jgi:hypothetical protein